MAFDPLGVWVRSVFSLYVAEAYLRAGCLPEITDPNLAALDRPIEVTSRLMPEPAYLKIGDLCPVCGETTFVVNEEACRKCYCCGHSEC